MNKSETRAERFADSRSSRYAVDTWNHLKEGHMNGSKEQIALDAKWIRENVGADVAVDFLNAMEG